MSTNSTRTTASYFEFEVMAVGLMLLALGVALSPGLAPAWPFALGLATLLGGFALRLAKLWRPAK